MTKRKSAIQMLAKPGYCISLDERIASEASNYPAKECYLIRDLEKSEIYQAVELVHDNIFPGEAQLAKKEFTESFNGHSEECEYLKYWGIHDAKDKMIGVTGIYKMSDESIMSGVLDPGVVVEGLYDILEDPKNTFWIGWFALDKDHQRRGIGTRAVDFMKQKSAEKNGKELCVYCENEPRKFYEAIGFDKVYEIKDCWAPGEDMSLMRCRLY